MSRFHTAALVSALQTSSATQYKQIAYRSPNNTTTVAVELEHEQGMLFGVASIDVGERSLQLSPVLCTDCARMLSSDRSSRMHI